MLAFRQHEHLGCQRVSCPAALGLGPRKHDAERVGLAVRVLVGAADRRRVLQGPGVFVCTDRSVATVESCLGFMRLLRATAPPLSEDLRRTTDSDGDPFNGLKPQQAGERPATGRR